MRLQFKKINVYSECCTYISSYHFPRFLLLLLTRYMKYSYQILTHMDIYKHTVHKMEEKEVEDIVSNKKRK